MAALVLVEHDHHSLKAATHHAVSAAKLCSPEVDLLLIGSNAGLLLKLQQVLLVSVKFCMPMQHSL
jgi:electron transfer flavoprotein alpha subunit